eukprot:TRINITY_DN2873_c0_g4_i2.p1 TRINITY_DN2873_c0_g4~~TRINITY_DN2873_c0_g4_i2.p1  ORF type:complete len:217 (-),score=66.74 TRINITY_DN2873_c0_g4_i2:776-1399(-)
MSIEQGEFDYIFKIVLLGETSVGKSCLFRRFTKNQWSDRCVSTIGVDFKIRNITCKGKNVKLQIWDTAGQVRFSAVVTNYYRGAHGLLLVYDVSSHESFEKIQELVESVRKIARPEVVLILVGNKTDLDESERQVTMAEAEQYAITQDMMFIETSAKANTNVEEAFQELTIKLIDNVVEDLRSNEDLNDKIPVNVSDPISSNDTCSC